MCCRNHPRKQSCQAGRKKNRSAWRRWGGRGGACVSWCLAPSDLVFPRPFPGEMDERAHREACVGCRFHNRRIPSSFFLTCLSVLLPSAPLPVCTCSYNPLALLSGSAQAQTLQAPLPYGLKRPTRAERLDSNSPLLCWSGCWATDSLLELCPMLRRPFPPACLGLPLQRPQAAERNLKPPQSASAKHGVCAVPARPGCLLQRLTRLASPLPSSRRDWVSPCASL